MILEVVILTPAAMIVILFVLQACLWAHAGNIVQDAASQGVEAASFQGGSAAAGRATALQLISSSGRNAVADPSVQVSDLPGQVVEIHVVGSAESIVPWLHLGVSATRTAPLQEFRVAG